MNSPFVSVIIPVYNVERYLHQCVDSVLSQSFSDFEVILVDDGSPDGCPLICDEYAEKDARVRVIHKPNGGVSSARNVGIAAAASELILFCDGDDYYMDGAFEKIARIVQSTTADVYCFSIRKETKDGVLDIISPKYEGELSDTLLLSLAYAGFVTSNDTTINVSPFNKVYRKSIINQHALQFDETLRIAEDISFNVAYFSKCDTVICMNEPLYFYRMNLCSAIHVDKGFAEKGMERSVYFLSMIQRALEERVSGERLYPIAKNRYNRLVIDACEKNHKRECSFSQRRRFAKDCVNWYFHYLDTYGVSLRTVRPVGKKARMENFLISHRAYALIDLYTWAIRLYHRFSTQSAI